MVAMLLCSISMSAHDFEVGGIYYNITSSTNLTVEVTCRGNYYDSYSNEYSGAVTIPETVTYNNNTYSVTSIGSGAFSGCSGLTSITIPNSVTSIGGCAFENCTNLKEVIFEDGSETLSLGCNYYSYIGTGQGLFYDCPLESVYLGRNLSYYTSSDYGTSPFYGITTITSVTIGDKVTSIGSYAFSGCSELTSVDIPDSVTSIGSYAFSGCSGLTSVDIPDSVTSIGNYAFYGCTGLTALTIGRGLSSIKMRTFSNCRGLTTLTIGDGVTSIGNYAFSDCSKLVSVTIPGGVTSIGNYVFDNCSSLKEVILEDGEDLLTLGYNYVEEALFYDCPLESVYLGRSLSYDTSSSYGYSPFYNKTTLTSVTIGEKATSIGDYSFYNCNGIASVVIPDNVTIVGSSAFYGCTGLCSLTLGDGVSSISSSAFYGCTNLSSLVIPNGVTSIGSSAFSGCSGLESAIIGNGVTEFGSYAFYNCTALTNLTIGSSVSSIGNYAFASCNEIESIYALNTKAITCDESIFATDAYNNAILHVPSDRVFAYEKATPWKKFLIEPMKKFTITFMVDGKVYETKEVEYASEIKLIENPIKEGYTFTGWSEVSETMPAKDIVVNGSFVANKYLVTFKVGDEVIAADSLVYGSEIIVPKAPEKEGYTFNGWGEVPETVPANDVIYEGTYSINSYRLIYYVDGEIYMVDMLTYGAVIELLEKPTKNGYTFEGWSKAPETMPAEDVTISGTFTRVNVTHITITVNQYGSGTYCSPYALDFSNVEGLKAYAATGYNNITGVVTLTRVMTAQPGEGLFIKGEPGKYMVPVMESTGDHTINMLKGTLTATPLNKTSDDGLYRNFRYTTKTGVPTPMFYEIADGYTLSANRAYLQIPTAWLPADTKSIALRFDEGEGTTDMDPSTLNPQLSTEVYDLQGRRVDNPTSGIYIIDGKQVVIK